jgi:hypothetical protein
MKNHWTDQKAIKSYINRLSKRVASLVGVEPQYVIDLLIKDFETNPPTDEELDKIRDADDEAINRTATLIQKTIGHFADDGLW